MDAPSRCVRYGVVACPRCNRVQAVETRHANPSCRGCGKRFPLAERKLLFSTDDERLLPPAVGRLAAQQAGQPIEELAEALAAADEPTPKGIPALLAALGEDDGTFTADEFAETAQRIGVPGPPERLLATLVRDSLVFEPRPGLFRLLG